MKPWKRMSAMLYEVCPLWLQWGHGDEAVEEDPNAEVLATGRDASMGPRR